MAYGDKKPGALAILIPHAGKGGGSPPPDSEGDDTGDSDLPGEFVAKFHEYYAIEDDPKSTEDDCAKAFYAAVQAAMNGGD